MSNYQTDILERLDIKNKAALSHLLSQSLTTHRRLNSVDLAEPVSVFKMPAFLKGVNSLLTEVPKKMMPHKAVEILFTCFEIFGYDVSKQECFLLYNLRDLGKFRIKDQKLFTELEAQWGEFQEYRVEKSDFKVMLRELKNIKFIEMRRGAITLVEQVVLS